MRRSRFKSPFSKLISILVTLAIGTPLAAHAQPARRYTKPYMSNSVIDLNCAKNQTAPGLTYVAAKGSNLSPGQKSMADGVMARARALGAGHLVQGTRVRVFTGGRPTTDGGVKCSSYAEGGKSIQLSNCNGPSSDNPIKHLAHELGHVAGQQNSNYARYNRIQPRCTLTTYCTHSNRSGRLVAHSDRNEEFAEVFAMYMFAPERLKANNSCKNAFNFMQSEIFKNGPDPTNGCAGYLGAGVRTTKDGTYYNVDGNGDPITEFDRLRSRSPSRSPSQSMLQSNSGTTQTGPIAGIINMVMAVIAARNNRPIYNYRSPAYQAPVLQDAVREQPGPVSPWGNSR